MAVRRLASSTNDDIITATGALSGMTHGTIVTLLKRDSTGGDFRTLFCLHNSSGTPRTEKFIDISSDAIGWYNGTHTSQSDAQVLDQTDRWYLVVARKTSGTTTPRFSVYDYSTESWSHQNGSSTMPNGLTAGAGGSVRFSFDGSEHWDGLIAARAAWSNNLPWAANTTGDSAIEAAGLEVAAANWDAANPSAGWLFDQASTSTAVEDWTGNGADQSSISGTAVVTDDDPPGFDFSLDTEAASGGSETTVDVTADGAGSKQADGAAEASVDVTAEGSGVTARSGAAAASVDVTAAGTGTSARSGGSEASVTVSATGAGATGRSSGSGSDVTVTTVGAGTRSGSGGSTVDVTITAAGAGTTSREGGTDTTVTVTATGGGTPDEPPVTGGSAATVDVTALGGGVKATASGSQASVTVTAEALGVAARSGGSETTVLVTADGATASIDPIVLPPFRERAVPNFREPAVPDYMEAAVLPDYRERSTSAFQETT